jgi:hypothetical protein
MKLKGENKEMLGIAAKLVVYVLWKCHQCYSHLTQVHVSFRSCYYCCRYNEYSDPVSNAGVRGHHVVQNCIVQNSYGKNEVT